MSVFGEQASVCPQFSEAEARAIVRERYGVVAATIKPLGSFQDQNFQIDAADGRQFVLKIANAAATFDALDLQNRALAHLAAKDAAFPTPQLVPALGAELMPAVLRDGATYFVRLLTFLPGRMLAHVTRAPGPALLATIGRFAGALTQRLAGFAHPAGAQISQWDMRHAPEVVRAFLPYITVPEQRALIETMLQRYQTHAAPLLAGLPTSMIHCDITSYNLLLDADASGQLAVSGLIDFGDMVHSYTVGELAVAVSEAALDGEGDPLAAAVPMVAAYHQAHALGENELAVLFPMLCLRRCVVAVSVAQQLHFEPGNAYVRELSAQDWPVLAQLRNIAPELALAVFRAACGLEPHPAAAAVRGWLADQREQLVPVVPPELLDGATVLDLGVGSDRLREGVWEAPAALRAALGGPVAIGRYGEVRLAYSQLDASDEPAALHLGLDLLLPPGTPVCAAHTGDVARAEARELIVRHAPAPGVEFFTRYAGVCPREGLVAGAQVLAGQLIAAVADASDTSFLPPHLHVQIGCALLDGELPGLGRARERAAWLSLCPDPQLLLGQAGPGGPAEASAAELFARRARVVQQAQEYYYQRPMRVVRGWRQYLYDDAGRAYLDAINNVAHVGHGHPRVVAAAQRQMALLNTNARFLYGSMVEYAERLIARLPNPLRVVFFVCTGSEANDLALRLARAYTQQHDVIVIDGEYHGNTTAVDEISTSLLDNPAAKHTRPWVHAVLRPNTYRGPYGADDPECGAKYAREVDAAIKRIQAQQRGPAAFFTEALLGSSGGSALPDGYLHGVYGAVHAAGGVCIADEVQVGFGRVGTHFWAFETQGVVPDIVTMGKPIGNGFPLAAVVTTPEIAEAFRSSASYFNTYGGNPVACEVGMAVLDIIEDEGLQANALAVGRHFKAALHDLLGRHELIGAVYGLGMYMGVELVRDRAGKAPATAAALALAERMRELGVIVYPTGDFYNILKIKPPLVFSRANAEFFAAMLDRALREGLAA